MRCERARALVSTQIKRVKPAQAHHVLNSSEDPGAVCFLALIERHKNSQARPCVELEEHVRGLVKPIAVGDRQPARLHTKSIKRSPKQARVGPASNIGESMRHDASCRSDLEPIRKDRDARDADHAFNAARYE